MDLDGDGHKDVISGSWPGELYLFRGTGKGEFLPPVMILGADGLPLNVGGGVRETANEILITGNGKFVKDGDEDVVEYNGKRYKGTPEKQVYTTGCASAVYAADWNGDGLLDLLVGEIRGRVGLYLNEGSARAYKYGKPRFLQAGGKEIQVPHGDAGPCVADWDGDGLFDLVVGAGDGGVLFYRNEGSAKEPRLAAGVTLVPAGRIEYDGKKVPAEPTRGVRAKVCVADWNGDGKVDLLVGDINNQRPAPKKLTDEEAKRVAEATKRREVLTAEYQKLTPKIFGATRVKDRAEAKKVSERLRAVQKELGELYKVIPPEYETHGWVWLFERTAVEAARKR